MFLTRNVYLHYTEHDVILLKLPMATLLVDG